jgi:hypothetical protein
MERRFLYPRESVNGLDIISGSTLKLMIRDPTIRSPDWNAQQIDIGQSRSCVDLAAARVQ